LTEFVYHFHNADMNPLVGRYVKALRQERNWSQQKLAHEARLSPNTIRKIERGMKRPPRTATLDRIAKVFHLTTRQLYQGPKGIVATDPQLAGLNYEDVEIARQYHDAPTKLRTQIQVLLVEGTQGETMQILQRLATLSREMIASLLTLGHEAVPPVQETGSQPSTVAQRPQKPIARKTS
jgi:transcriptional regulator with XRE-family HTH domain